ncbi:MAG: adenylyltransferase/cytidyltransferase family protein [Tannerella sp.]|jgi:cytidyltransferase-like protein|nr:adenylyltransferase/cytidyltransferase family protein [Tannerella sp.]
MKKVFVSGCYDMLHSGHVAFFEEASQHGDLYVGIGSDATVGELKARKTVNTDAERLYMVKALKVVKDAWINSGSGILDFEEEVKRLKPDIFFVNSDGHSPVKERFCEALGIEYIVSRRIPHAGLPARSTTALREECLIPFRIDLAGGWLDQPFVNRLYPGAVITVCIEPDYEFNDRSGMSTSSRKKAIELWQTNIPEGGDREKYARTLFCYENPPGTEYVSGSQDSLGIVMPGLNYFYYNNGYWPEKIISRLDGELLTWIEQRVWLIPLYPRKKNYNVLARTDITAEKAKALSMAADRSWEALLSHDAEAWGRATAESYKAQISMFPNMAPEEVQAALRPYQSKVLGWKLSGAGGGGYLVLIGEQPVEHAIQIRIRRE